MERWAQARAVATAQLPRGGAGPLRAGGSGSSLALLLAWVDGPRALLAPVRPSFVLPGGWAEAGGVGPGLGAGVSLKALTSISPGWAGVPATAVPW